jgi:hypothetical protein
MLPGQLGLDHAGRPGDYRAFARAAVQAGYKFEFRYLCDPAARDLNKMKIARPEEVAAAQDEGLSVLFVWQNTKQDALGGYAAGKQHGEWAAYQAAMSGYAEGSTIVFAVGDYDAPTSDYPTIIEYVKGVIDGINGRYKIGGYGKRAVVEYLKSQGMIGLVWQSYGFSRPVGEISPEADVYQRREQVTIAGITCDVNEWRKVPKEAAVSKNPICPFAVQHILHGEEDRRPTFNPIASALHIAVTTASGDSLGRYFDSETNKNDSTFYVDKLGGIWQFGPVNRVANAQFGGNSYAVSIETWGLSGPLNPAQVAALIKLYAWLKTEWGIPLTLSTRWNGPGAGWHSKYPEWNKNAHACPGDDRVKQLKEIILPGAIALVNGVTPVHADPEEEDMPRKFIVADPYRATPAPGREPHFIVCEQENVNEVAIASVNGATFFPAWKEGTKTADYEDFVFLGLWWRRYRTVTGKPTGAFVNEKGVHFTAEGTPGTYTLAVK